MIWSMAAGDPAPSTPKSDRPSDPRKAGSDDSLVRAATKWMDESLIAWANDDYVKVAALAPLAVELLGKAVLWRANPALLVPLNSNAEASLFALCRTPALDSPKLRTVGLREVLERLERLLGALGVEKPKRRALTDVRNGAMHVGSPAQSRDVLVDCVTLVNQLLAELGIAAETFYGSRHRSATTLLDQKRSEVGHRVAAKMASARHRLSELEERLGAEIFQEATTRLEAEAELEREPSTLERGSIAQPCPECSSKARLYGAVDLSPEVDFDVEPVGDGQYESYVSGTWWEVSFAPRAFDCPVCQLTLIGTDQLVEAGLPASRQAIESEALGEDFDPDEFAEEYYGLPD